MSDNRETIEFELVDEDFLWLARRAHELDITFNDLVNKILREELDRIEARKVDPPSE